MKFNEKLIQLRKRKGLTQQELAQEIGVSRKSIQYYEEGDRLPRRKVINRMCEVFNVSPEFILSEDERFIVAATEADGTRGRITAEQVVENVGALFAGGELSEEDKDAVMKAIQDLYWDAKNINKKYTPKKYLHAKKNDDNN